MDELVGALAAQPLLPLPGPSLPAATVGVYALYLAEDRVDLYRPAFRAGVPLYVGKAEPSGGRSTRGRAGRTSPLTSRVRKHERSLTDATNLHPRWFKVRALPVDPLLVEAAERALIAAHEPVWNVVVAGFGNNPTGGPRARQACSDWDALRPGRPGRGSGRPRRALTDLEAAVTGHLIRASHQEPGTVPS